MSTANKYMQSASGAGGEALNVEDVFSTYLYDGNSTARSIVNGIDLSGEGGLVWTKLRGPNNSTRHVWIDTVRGVEKYLESNTSDAEETQSSNSLTAFNSNGYSVGNWGSMNASFQTYASWTFRKAPKFFDVVTYTGNGNASQALSHNLGGTVGCIMVKRIDNTSNWYVYHRSLIYALGPGAYQTTSAGQNSLYLNATNNVDDNAIYWNNTDATSTNFTVGSAINISGGSYVAYLFAHNNGDGKFGPDADQDGVKCSYYVGNGTSDFSKEIDVGFEPQFVIVKKTSQSTDTTGWGIADAMRGFNTGNTNWLIANTSAAESTLGGEYIELTSTGFKVGTTTWNSNTAGYIYIAIRRGTKVPESATEVFDVQTYTASTGTVRSRNFAPDLLLGKSRTLGDSGVVTDRLRGFLSSNSNLSPSLFPALTNAEANQYPDEYNVNNNSFTDGGYYNNYSLVKYAWKRAPSYMDCVAYLGNSTAGRTVSHNLGVAPEMMWVKRRDSAGEWMVYHSGMDATAPEDYYMRLSETGAKSDSTIGWNDTAPTASVFSLGSHNWVNGSGNTYIAYLFASLDGVSKVGSYTGNGSSQTIDCGFSSGARFVLIKPASDLGDWSVYDSTRGIVAGNDARLMLDRNDAEENGDDRIDPFSSGFTAVHKATGRKDSNTNGVTYIFYAIA